MLVSSWSSGYRLFDPAWDVADRDDRDRRRPPMWPLPGDFTDFPASRPASRRPVLDVRFRRLDSRDDEGQSLVFGELVEDGKIWRLGANEATEIEFFRDVKIAGKTVKKGRYTMYALESPAKWTVIINKETDVWGAFKYDAAKDVVRVDCPVTKTADITESFSMMFEKATEKSINLIMDWDDVMVKMQISW